MSAATARQLAPSVTPEVVVPAQRSPREDLTRHLRPVPATRPRAARGPFIALIALVLGAGLLLLLGLNTVLAQGSFAAYDLKSETAALADREQALLQEVAVAESPQHLEKAATRLGMIPSINPVFLRLSDGKVLGVPVPAKAAPKPKPVVKPKAATTTTATTPKTTDSSAAKKPAANKKPEAKKSTSTDTAKAGD